MRTLVTGSSGMLGSAVMRELKTRKEKERIGWAKSVAKAPDGTRFERVDLGQWATASRLLRNAAPELVIHCAALTDADFCEENRSLAYEINALVPDRFAVVAKEVGAKFVYVSTDAVYDDSRPGRRAESEQPNPQSVYAATKLEGEGRVLSAYPEALVVRTTMFGWTLPTAPRPKFAEQILGALTARRPISLWMDAVFSPLYVELLGGILLDLGELGTSGILNVGARQPVSKAHFGYLLAEEFGLDPSFIERVKVASTPLKARRTRNVGLDVRNVERLVGRMPTVQDGIDLLYQDAFDGTAKKIRGREGYP